MSGIKKTTYWRYPGRNVTEFDKKRLLLLVAKYYRIPKERFFRESRESPGPEAKAVFAYLLAEQVGRARASTDPLSSRMKSRTGVSAVISNIIKRLPYDPQLQEDITEIRRRAFLAGVLPASELQEGAAADAAHEKTLSILYPEVVKKEIQARQILGTAA